MQSPVRPHPSSPLARLCILCMFFCTMCILESEGRGNGFVQTFDVNHLA